MAGPSVSPPRKHREENHDMYYRQIPTASYVPISRDEVVVKGSSIEGFTLVIEDPERRGVTADVVSALSNGGDAEEICRAVSRAKDLGVEAVQTILDELADSGAIMRDEWAAHDDAAWLSFVRFGNLPDLAQGASLTLVGGRSADTLAAAAMELGLRVTVVPSADDLDVTSFSPTPELPTQIGEGGLPIFPKVPEHIVLLWDGTQRAAMYRINESLVGARVPFLSCQVDGVEVSVGPYVVPGRTACLWEVERLWARSTASESHYETLLASGVSRTSPLVTRHTLTAAALPWLIELAMRGTSSLAGEVVRVRATNSVSTQHAVMRLPRCPVCMPLAPAVRNPLY